MAERERAMSEIEQVLDLTEAIAGADDVNNPYTHRIIWGPSPDMQRELARDKARNLQLRVQEMVMFHAPSKEIWRTAVFARALAVVASDRVTGDNMREIVDRFSPKRTYSLEERREIHRKALEKVADHKPPSPPKKSTKTETDRDVRFRRLAQLIDKLRMRTTARGFTREEARMTRDRVHDILRGNQTRDTGLSPAELEIFRHWFSRR